MKFVFPLIIVAAICIAIALGNFLNLPIQTDIAGAAAKVVGALFVVTVFVERSTAVITTIWFTEALRAAVFRYDLERENFARLQISDAPVPPALAAAASAVATVEAQKSKLGAYVSFIIGLFVSAAGVRTLENLLVLPTIAPFQAGWLHVIDAVITAGLIAGGSAGVAAIADLLAKFFHLTQQRLETAAGRPVASVSLDGIPAGTPR